MKHSPQIALQAARRELDLAHEDCPHWDYENHDDSGKDCCTRLLEAKRMVRIHRAKFDRITRDVAR